MPLRIQHSQWTFSWGKTRTITKKSTFLANAPCILALNESLSSHSVSVNGSSKGDLSGKSWMEPKNQDIGSSRWPPCVCEELGCHEQGRAGTLGQGTWQGLPQMGAGLRKGGLAARTCWQPGVGAAWEDVRRGLGTGSSAGMADNSRVR